MTVHASYVLMVCENLLSLTDDNLFLVGHQNTEDSHPIPSFDEKLLMNLCSDVINVLKIENNILKIDDDTFVVGDLHGNYHDLLRILNYASKTTHKIIFLGDYVDRGHFSIECITLLFSLKVMYPDKYFLLRGNHEFDCMCSQYGFKKAILNHHNPKKIEKIVSAPTINYFQSSQIYFKELLDIDNVEETTDNHGNSYFDDHSHYGCYRYTEKLYESFLDAFSYLPIAAIVNTDTLCIHGGLSPYLDKVEKIERFIQRPISNYDQNQLLIDLLWSDPSIENCDSFLENPRGKGKLFNCIATSTFLRNNNLQRIIRAHECVKNGIEFNFNDKCITVFSASSYNQDLGNKSGILKLHKKDNRIEPIIFKPFKRLIKCDTLYYKVQKFNDSNISKPLLSHFNIKSISSLKSMPNQAKSNKNAALLLHLPKNIIAGMPSNRKKGSCGRSLSFTTCSKLKNNSKSITPKNSLPCDISCFNNFKINEFGNENEDQKSSDDHVNLPSLNKSDQK